MVVGAGAARAAAWRAGVLALGLILAGPAGAALAAVKDGTQVDAGRQALVAAAAERKAAYALEGQVREAALLSAAQTFGVVADDEQMPDEIRSEGAFRAGELLRAREKVEDAVRRFAQAVVLGRRQDQGPARTFAARAQLELAHVARRANMDSEALAAYAEVVVTYPDQPRQQSQAVSWRARLLTRAERVGDVPAEAAILAALMETDALEAIRCADDLAQTLSDAGRPELARAVLADLDALLAPRLASAGSEADRLAEARAAVRVTLEPEGR